MEKRSGVMVLDDHDTFRNSLAFMLER
jgi:DNA-binding NarL/FixJ family response regulator